MIRHGAGGLTKDNFLKESSKLKQRWLEYTDWYGIYKLFQKHRRHETAQPAVRYNDSVTYPDVHCDKLDNSEASRVLIDFYTLQKWTETSGWLEL